MSATTSKADGRIGRGTTLDAGMSIAYATLDYILQHIGCRTLFATHYHELATMLGAPAAVGTHVDTSDAEGDGRVRGGVRFFCTDVDEMVSRCRRGELTTGRRVQLLVPSPPRGQLRLTRDCKLVDRRT